jgi:LPS sulfotransferase NodH
LLCDLLSGTGIAGQPHSYYRREDILDYARKWGVSSPDVIGDEAFERTYLAAVRRAGTTQTGIFGLRLMWSSVVELFARLSAIHPDPLDDPARFELAFGQPLYIHLSRQDKVAQAVSLLKARQGGLWHRAADGTERERLAPPAPMVYNADRLAGLVEELETDDAAWNGWFARFGIAPLRLTYERLAASPQTGWRRCHPHWLWMRGLPLLSMPEQRNWQTKPAWNGLIGSAEHPGSGRITDAADPGPAV